MDQNSVFSLASLIIAFALLFPEISYGQAKDEDDPIDPFMIDAVLEVENSAHGTGSGFLIGTQKRTFLVTNKHVIGIWTLIDPFAPYDSISVKVYSNIQNQVTPTKIKITTADRGKLRRKVVIHPNPKIDVAIIEITDVVSRADLSYTSVLDSSFLQPIDSMQGILGYGTQVFAIGYPSGYKSQKTNQPLVKAGYLSSASDGSIVIKENWPDSRGRERYAESEGKILVVDGLIIPGNSGGPVLTSKEAKWVVVDGQLRMSRQDQNFIVGIVSHVFIGTGLTVVYASDHVLEVLRLSLSK